MKEVVSDMVKIWAQYPEEYSDLLWQAGQLEKCQDLSYLKVPLLYVCGEPVRGDVDLIRSLKQDTIFKKIDSGHFIMLNQPTLLNESISHFMKSNCL